ncbi:hypothetical protein U1Q18_026060 [Sarracenia purpurea var. burkii]
MEEKTAEASTATKPAKKEESVRLPKRGQVKAKIFEELVETVVGMTTRDQYVTKKSDGRTGCEEMSAGPPPLFPPCRVKSDDRTGYE